MIRVTGRGRRQNATQKLDTMDGDMKKIMQTMERIEMKLDKLLASRKKKRVRVVAETPPSLLHAENTTEKDLKRVAQSHGIHVAGGAYNTAIRWG